MKINKAQLPEWLEKNSFFRKLFILRKLYLSKTSFKHYSQFGEDISIKRFFVKNHKGFFVDVGCFHPKKYNNSYQLYKRGWRGINIDLDPIKIEGFNIVRPKDTNIVSAVSTTQGEVEYYSNGFYSLTTSLDENFVAGKTGYTVRKTHSNTLDKLIANTPFKGKCIDFLSVDAEGYDLEVLKSLDFETYQPKLVAVEIHDPLLTDVQNSDLYQYLAAKNYCLVGWCGLTLLMASPDFQITLKDKFAYMKGG